MKARIIRLSSSLAVLAVVVEAMAAGAKWG